MDQTDDWTSTDLAIWAGTFGRLRDKFQDAEERKIRVGALLVEGGQVGEKPPRFPDSLPWLFGLWEGVGKPSRHFYRICGTERDGEALADIAAEAGRTLAKSPPWVLGDIGKESRRWLVNRGAPSVLLREPALYLPTHDALRWVFAVFALAWQKRRGSSLHADRIVWFDNREARLDGFENLKRWVGDNPEAHLTELLANNTDPPTRWYSTLDDLANASVCACEQLLTIEQSLLMRPRSIQRARPAADGDRRGPGLDDQAAPADSAALEETADGQPQGDGDAAGNGEELPECLVTLQQAAPFVNRCKRTLERLTGKRGFPRPKVQGGGGKPNEYEWSELRVFLEKHFKRPLPKTFPAQRFRPT